MIYNHGGFSLSKSYFPMAKNHPNWSQLVGTRALPIDQKTPPVIGLPSEKRPDIFDVLRYCWHILICEHIYERTPSGNQAFISLHYLYFPLFLSYSKYLKTRISHCHLGIFFQQLMLFWFTSGPIPRVTHRSHDPAEIQHRLSEKKLMCTNQVRLNLLVATHMSHILDASIPYFVIQVKSHFFC